MKIIAFTIPVRQDQTVIVKRESGAQFYPHLHRHEEIQLTWVEKGAGALVVGEQLLNFKAGEVFLFSANLPHLFKNDITSVEEEHILALSLFFRKDNVLWELPELKSVRHFLGQMQGAFRAKAAYRPAIQRDMQAIENRPSGLRLPLFIELMHRLVRRSELELIGESTGAIVSDREGLRVNTILQFAMTHYRRTITLEEAAREVHMVPGSFCRFFKQRTGKTFIRFLNEIRIREACHQLAFHPEQPISEIAFRCGFKNVSSFNRVFRQILDQSPTGYLASLKKLL